MEKASKINSLPLSIFVFFSALSVPYFIWSFVKESVDLHPCVYQVGDYIVEYSNIADFAHDHDNWYVLTEEQSETLLSKYNSGCLTIGSMPEDMKENKYQMAVRKTGEHSFEVTVWSKGFDNISGTKDDIVFPKGKRIPN